MFGRKRIKELEKDVSHLSDLFLKSLGCLEVATDMLSELSGGKVYSQKKRAELINKFKALKTTFFENLEVE